MSERRKVAVGRGRWPTIVLANRIFQNRRRRRLFHWVAWHFCNGGILLLSFGSFVFPSPFTVLSSSPRSSFNWVTTARKLNRKRHSWMQLERFEVRNRTRKKETLKTPLENRFRLNNCTIRLFFSWQFLWCYADLIVSDAYREFHEHYSYNITILLMDIILWIVRKIYNEFRGYVFLYKFYEIMCTDLVY